MTLLQKAKKDAQAQGKKVDSGVASKLNSVQSMHNLCKKKTGSPYRQYLARKK